MKTKLLLAAALLATAHAQAQVQVGQTVNELIPDDCPSGLASTINISGESGAVGDITVNLNINEPTVYVPGNTNDDFAAIISVMTFS